MNLKQCIIAAIVLQSTLTTLAQNTSFDSTIYYRITNFWQGEKKSLDIINDGKQNNLPRLTASDNVSGQSWKIVPLGGGYYKLYTQWQGPTRVLDVINDGKNNTLQLSKDGGYSGQFWKITPGENGYFRLTSMWQGESKSIDIVNDGKNNNEPVLANTGSFSGQYWKIVPFTKVNNSTVEPAEKSIPPVKDTAASLPVFKNLVSYRITNLWAVTKGKSLDAVNDGKKNKVQLAANGAYSGQYWTLTPIPGYTGYYRLTNKFLGNDLSLDIINDGTNNKITFAKTAMASGQAWKISRTSNGYYRLTTHFQGEGKSLDVLNDGKNTRLQLAKTAQVSGQHWMITEIQ